MPKPKSAPIVYEHSRAGGAEQLLSDVEFDLDESTRLLDDIDRLWLWLEYDEQTRH